MTTFMHGLGLGLGDFEQDGMTDSSGNPIDTAPKSDSGVAELQKVLKTYADKTGFKAADPGPSTGIVNLATALAVIAIIPKVPGLPDEVKALATIGTVLLASNVGQQQVFDQIKNNAGYISKAIIGLAVYQIASGNVPPQVPVVPKSVKAKTIWGTSDNLVVKTGALAPAPPPIVATAGGLIPGDPTKTIWFFDSFKSLYRVAVPGAHATPTSGFTEVSSSASQPAHGMSVTRTQFMTAIGQWWGTTTGMAAIAGGVIGLGALVFAGVRAMVR